MPLFHPLISPTHQWSQIDRKAAQHERHYQEAALGLLRLQGHNLIAMLDHTQRADPWDALLQRVKANFATGGVWNREWQARFEPLILQTMTDGGTALLQALGISPNVANLNVQEEALNRSDALANFVGQTLSDQIVTTVRDSRAAGLSISETADALNKQVFGGNDLTRAMLIARTETIGALNAGEAVTATDNGFREKSWLSQRDGRVRDSHATIDGQRILITDSFSNGLDYPGDASGPAEEVINCRCTLLYY